MSVSVHVKTIVLPILRIAFYVFGYAVVIAFAPDDAVVERALPK
jgi:hypothetical protein